MLKSVFVDIDLGRVRYLLLFLECEMIVFLYRLGRVVGV